MFGITLVLESVPLLVCSCDFDSYLRLAAQPDNKHFFVKNKIYKFLKNIKKNKKQMLSR